MNDTGLQQQMEAANFYDTFFVPALFQQWTGRMAEAARVAPGDLVLDVACGTGVLAREVKDRVEPRGAVVGLDVNPGMLAVAQRREPGITWREAAAEALPYDGGSFDAVVSQFGLMFFEDQRGALREMWRVLAPGGTLAVAVWDTLENTPAYAGEAELLSRMAGEQVGGVLRAPFTYSALSCSLGEPARLRELFAGAGIPSPTLTTQQGRARFASLRAMLDADIKAWLPLAGVRLNEEQTEAIVAEAERSLGEYVKSDGTVEFATPAHIVTASKA